MPPILFKLDKAGKLRYWECVVDQGQFKTRHGLFKTRDNHKWSIHERTQRYQVGHGSYTSAEDVAFEHAMSKWNDKKRNDAMVENPMSLGLTRDDVASMCQCDPDVMEQLNSDFIERISYPIPIAPVLATRYDKLKERHENPRARYTFPDEEVYAQYKIDGERCVASWIEGHGVKLFSRLRNEIPYCDHIKAIMERIYTSLGKVMPSIYSYHFDGELVVPGETRNMMRSAVSTMKFKHEDNDKIVFYIFDMITNYGDPFHKRWDLLRKIMNKVKTDKVMLVPVPSIPMMRMDDDEIVGDMLAEAMGAGYEGLILRTKDMPYPLANHRIDELIKVKKIHDEEFLIVDCYQGKDKEAGLIIFKMSLIDDPEKTFGARPCWSYDVREEAWQQFVEDPSTFIGKMATVSYEYKSEYNIPGNPRLIRLREDI